MKRNVLNSPRLFELKKRRQRAILNKILISGLGLLAIFSLLAYLSRLDSLNIKQTQVVGNKVIDTETIQKVVDEQITGKYFWLFPKTNILIYPKNSIIKELLNQFKRIKDVSISIKDNRILIVSLNERKALYTWCGISLPDVNNNATQKCYFLDEDGYVFDEAPYFSGDVYFRFYGKTDSLTSGVVDPLGHSPTGKPSGTYFYKQNFKQLISFKDTLTGLGVKPVALNITDNGDIEVYLSKGTQLSAGPKIILKIDSDFKNAAENLEAALTTEPLQSKFKTKYSSLLYLDLRFGNKVYFKFQ